MSVMNYVTSKVKVTCENKEAYAKIVELYKKHVDDYSICFQADGILFVAMQGVVETNFMSDHATAFLQGIVQYATEIDPNADIIGTISWQDDCYNTGKANLVKKDDKYIVSDPICRNREESIIHNATTEALINELKKRGFSVNRITEGSAEPEEKHIERWRVTIFRDGESSSRYFKDDEYDEALHYGACKKEGAYSVGVYEYDPATGEYVLGFKL